MLNCFNYIKNNLPKLYYFCFLFLIGLFFTACDNNNAKSNLDVSNKNLTKIYYIDANESKIVSQDYHTKGKTINQLVNEYLEELSQDPEDINLKKALPTKVKIKDKKVEDGILTINFNNNYSSLSGISEILCRATIVKTLSQIEGIDYIEFYINGQPLMDSNDNPVGLMQESDFVDNTDAEKVYVTIYFANEEGNALVGSNLMFPYNGNRSIEQLIIQQLINGPIEKNMIKTLPEGTELIKVTTKDNICYVDFNKKLLDKVPGVNEEIVLYSIVNSLDELSTINKVQFTINGETKATYGEDIPFDGLFERKLELVEGSK